MAEWIITDEVDRLAQTLLEEMGHTVDWRCGISRDELLSVIHRYEGMVISTHTAVDRTLIDRATALKIVARVGSGMEHVDRAYCTGRGITCLSSPEGNCNAVAEHVFGMLLALSNKLCTARQELQQGIWKREENRGFELKGRTVGIIGYGYTGSALAQKFRGWDTEVLAYDKYKQVDPSAPVKAVSLDELVRRSDIISFHVPYTAETHHWICAEFIVQCKPGVVLVNTSRGAVARTADLLPALESGHLGGLCIDVFEDEPIGAGKIFPEEGYRALAAHARVIATPHIAGWTLESKERLVRILIEKIAATR